MKKIVITSGYYNPAHIGHINLMAEAKQLGDYLIVIVNSDEQVKMKGSIPFMPEQERIEIIKAIKYVDEVFLSIDKDKTIIKSLEEVAKRYLENELIFAKGGDSTFENVPELDVCKRLGVKAVLGVGGGKVQSSSWLLKNSAEFKAKKA